MNCRLTATITIVMLAALLEANSCAASESSPTPGTPGSSFSPSSTPGTSMNASPAALTPAAPALAAPAPTGSQLMSLPPAPPALSPGALQVNDIERRGRIRSVRARLMGKKKGSSANMPPVPLTPNSEPVHDNSLGQFFQLPSQTTQTSVTPQVQPETKVGNTSLRGPLPVPVNNEKKNTTAGTTGVVTTGDASASDNDHAFHVGRLLYHVLDNAGIPVRYNRSDALDPSLKTTPASASLATSAVVTSTSQPKTGVTNSTSNAAANSPVQSTAAKIPESELEGVELPAPRDDQKITP